MVTAQHSMRRALSRKNLWEHSPRLVREVAGRCLGMLPPSMLLGRRFRECLAFAKEAQWWPEEKVRQYQLDQLRSICQLAYEKTSFYREQFRSVGFEPGDLRSIDDLAGLPTIDKETIRDRLDEMCTVPIESANVDYVATGGTTGQPLRFYASPGRSSVEYAYLVASWGRIGYDLRLPLAVFRGVMVEPNRDGLRHDYDRILRRHCYSNFHMSDENIGRYLDHVATIGPCYLHVYPSAGVALSRYLDRKGRRGPGNIRGIIAESENVFPADRALMERVLGARFFSCYGHSEKLVLAVECEHTTAYHVWPTYGYGELVDEGGAPVTKPGQQGEIVGTGFINRIVPFIRYRTGDQAAYGGERCEACGRAHRIFTTVKGRWPQGELHAADGSPITLTALNVHDDTFEGVRDYQFCQSTPGRATLRIVPVRALSEEEKRRIVAGISDRLQGQVELDLETRDELERTPTGKLLRVVHSRSPGAQ